MAPSHDPQSAKRREWRPRRIRRASGNQACDAIVGFTVERPDGAASGVLVPDSRESHINGEANHEGVSRPMERIAEAHGGGAVKGGWTYIDPTKYDGAREVPGLKLDEGSFISPHDVPDGVRLDLSDEKRYLIELRYLTDQEKIEFEETELPEIHFGLGRHSNRLVSLAVAASREFPQWEAVESALSQLASRWTLVNHFVARIVLRDIWSVLAEQVRELEAP